MLASLLADRAWDDIPAVKLVGLILGAMIMFVAIRSIFGKK
ncbi:hypothetical protein R8Z50_27560 [Longispora sp. K20-0274]